MPYQLYNLDTDDKIGNVHENFRNGVHAALDKLLGKSVADTPEKITLVRSQDNEIYFLHEKRNLPLIGLLETGQG